MPDLSISPQPTDEEAAAIVAAMHVLWPAPVVVETSPVSRRPTWRFANRWWSKPLAQRRDRPVR